MSNKIAFAFIAQDKFSRIADKMRKKSTALKRALGSLGDKAKLVARKMKTAFNKMKTGMRNFGIGAVAALGAAGAAMMKFINTADGIKKGADALGIASDAYQEFAYAADRAGVESSIFKSSMIAFTKRIGEAKSGMGPLVSGLKNLNPVLLENIKNSRNTEEAMSLMADAMKETKDPTLRAALANAAFSRAGISMVNVLKDGSEGLDGMRARARR